MSGLDHNTTYDEDEETELRDDVKNEIEKYGGVIVSDTIPRVDFAISFMHSRTDFYYWRNKADHFVTYDWLTSNAKNNFTVTTNWKDLVYFCQSNRLFSGMKIAPTGFDKFDQGIIRDIILAGGGQFMDGGLDKNDSTHLIVQKAIGKKYQAAKSWGLPIVTMEWLFECCQQALIDNDISWRQVSTEKFKPIEVDDTSDYQESPVRPKSGMPMPKSNGLSARKPAISKPNGSEKTDLPDRRLTCTSNSKTVRRSMASNVFEAQDMIDEFETPECRKKNDIPRTSDIHRGLAKAVTESNQENCEKKKRGLYSHSAIKDKNERMQYPKTPKLQVKSFEFY